MVLDLGVHHGWTPPVCRNGRAGSTSRPSGYHDGTSNACVVRLQCWSADWLIWCGVMQGGGGLGGKTQSLAHMWGQVQESDGEADTVLNPLNDESNSWAAFIDVSDCAFLWCYLQG